MLAAYLIQRFSAAYRCSSDTQFGQVTLKSVIKSRPLNTANQDQVYPSDYVPFYLYGAGEQKHITHMLVRSPNIALCGSNVSFSAPLPEEVSKMLPKGLILTLSEIPEASKQPLPVVNNLLPKNFFFGPRKSFQVDIWEDPNEAQSQGPGLLDDLTNKLYTGTMNLSEMVLVDAQGPNKDKFGCHSRCFGRLVNQRGVFFWGVFRGNWANLLFGSDSRAISLGLCCKVLLI